MNRRPSTSSPTRERVESTRPDRLDQPRPDRPRPVRRALTARNRKKPDVMRVVRYGIVLLMIGQCLRVAFTSPRMRLREVRVSGTKRLTPEQVNRLAKIELGQNIFRVNIAQVSRRLLAAPVIQEAVITRELPSTLNVEIRERTPALRLTADGASMDADPEGIVFQHSTAASDRLPVLQLASGQLPPVGRHLPSDLIRAVWDCSRLAKTEAIGLRNMRVDGAGELWLNVATHAGSPASADGPDPGLDVRVGRWTDLAAKLHDVRQVLASWPDLTARAAYLNVMCAGRPAYLRAANDSSSRGRKVEN